MSKIIKVVKLSTPEETRVSLRSIVNQLQANNYAISSDMNAVRLFSRFIPKEYKDNKMIIFSRPVNRPGGVSVITVKPDFVVEKCGEYSFRIKTK